MDDPAKREVVERVDQFREFVTERDHRHDECIKAMRADVMAQYESVVTALDERFKELYGQLKTRFEQVFGRLEKLEQQTMVVVLYQPTTQERVKQLIDEMPPGSVRTLATDWEEST